MTSLDFSRFQHSGVQVTGFQAVDFSDPRVEEFLDQWESLTEEVWPGAGTRHFQTDSALSVDMVQAISSALDDMVARKSDVFDKTFRRGTIYNNSTKGIPCNTKPVLPWMHGEAIYNALKKVNFEGLTGHVQFDDRGQRTNYTLDIISVTQDIGLSKIGRWHSDYGILANDDTPNGTPGVDQGNFTDEVYPWDIIVTTLLEPPFLMLRKDDSEDDDEVTKENDKYEGYTKDLAEEIGRRLKVDYHLRLAPDGEHGRELSNGTWTGMVGDLVHGAADMAIGPLTITAARERVIDFSKSFMDIGISIMIRRPEKQKPGLFSFMEPFSVSLWVSILLAYIIISFTVFIVSRFSPYQPKSRRRRYNDDFKHNFTLCNSFWFAMGALMMQGSVLCPRSIAGRIIGGVWWFFVLIVISSYTANLAAFLTIERMIQPIESADDLAEQTDIAYGMLETGTTRVFFETSNVTTYRMMWNYMSSASPPVMVKTVEEGVKRVQDSGGKYAFILESSTNDYYNNRKPCNTIKVGPNLNLKSFGIATPHGSYLKDPINYISLKLKEDGTLHRLKERWWEEKGGCGVDTGNKESKKRSLSLSNVAGVFLLLIGGLVIAIGVGLIEARYNRSRYGTSVFASSDCPHENASLNNGNIVYNKCITPS
ncbi:glutamate receptor [Plakobranchus ocellatus]|uniref:Glutamate receptor n=1 Tax=Plakobranchus ocellatus TaxID=259542 RepID=A0AAV4DMP0_9GAST|nr:glutamate receptor [Plakobranchus ocellatus]